MSRTWQKNISINCISLKFWLSDIFFLNYYMPVLFTVPGKLKVQQLKVFHVLPYKVSPLGRQCPSSTHRDIQNRTVTLDSNFKSLLCLVWNRLESGQLSLYATVPACQKSARSVKQQVNDRPYPRIKKPSGLKITQ